MSGTQTAETTIDIRRIFDATVDEVWRSWTTGDGLRAWYAPVDGWIVHTVDVDLREGGTLHIEFGPEGSAMRVVEDWTFEAVEDRKRLVYSLTLSYETDRGKVNERTHVTLELADAQGKTEVRLIETGYTSRAVRDTHQAGLTRMLDQLESALTA